MKKFTFLTAALLLLIGGAKAQSQLWAAASESNGNIDEAYTIDVDQAGNKYVAGMYVGTLRVNGVDYTNYINDGSSDAFIIKYNRNGVVQWVQTINGLSAQEIRCIKVNRTTGEVYVSGIFYYDFYINGVQQNSQTYMGFPGSFYRTFIVKYDANGNHQWSNDTYSAAGYTIEGAYSIALSPDGSSVYFHVGYIGDVEFEDGIIHLPDGFGIEGMLLAKINTSTGVVSNVRNDIDKYLFYGHLLATDRSGNVYYAGTHSRECMEEIDPVFAPCLENPTNVIQGFVWKMDANFNSIWGKEISGDGFENVDAIETDQSNNVYIYGSFTDDAIFDANVLTHVSGKYNGYVAKLTPSGNYAFIEQFDADGLFMTQYPNDLEAALSVDKKGNVFIGGGFGGTLNMQSESLTTIVYPSLHYCEGYLIKLNKQGDMRWMQQYTATFGPFDKTWIHGIAANNNSIVVAGHMVNENTYMGETILSDANAYFVSSLEDCDVKITITTTTNAVNAMNPATLSTPLKPGYTYQWQRNNVDIAGATSNTYETTLFGNYKCIVSTGACTLTSNRIHLSHLPRLGDAGYTTAEIYPNPASDHFTILLSENPDDATLTVVITDITGKVVLEENAPASEDGSISILMQDHIPSGTYFVSITGADFNLTLPIVFE